MHWNVNSLHGRCLSIVHYAALRDNVLKWARWWPCPRLSSFIWVLSSETFPLAPDQWLISSPCFIHSYDNWSYQGICTPVSTMVTCFSLWVLALDMCVSMINTSLSAQAPEAFSILSDPDVLYLPSCLYFWGHALQWLPHPVCTSRMKQMMMIIGDGFKLAKGSFCSCWMLTSIYSAYKLTKHNRYCLQSVL